MMQRMLDAKEERKWKLALYGDHLSFCSALGTRTWKISSWMSLNQKLGNGIELHEKQAARIKFQNMRVDTKDLCLHLLLKVCVLVWFSCEQLLLGIWHQFMFKFLSFTSRVVDLVKVSVLAPLILCQSWLCTLSFCLVIV